MSKLGDVCGSEVKNETWQAGLNVNSYELRPQSSRHLWRWVARADAEALLLATNSKREISKRFVRCLPLPNCIASVFGRASFCQCPECGLRQAYRLPFRAACAEW